MEASCYVAVLRGYGARDQLVSSLDVLRLMAAAGVRPDMNCFSAALDVCRRCSGGAVWTIGILAAIQQSDFEEIAAECNVPAEHRVIVPRLEEETMLAEAGRPPMLPDDIPCPNKALVPNRACVVNVIATFGKAGWAGASLKVFEMATKQWGIEVNLSMLSALLCACLLPKGKLPGSGEEDGEEGGEEDGGGGGTAGEKKEGKEGNEGKGGGRRRVSVSTEVPNGTAGSVIQGGVFAIKQCLEIFCSFRVGHLKKLDDKRRRIANTWSAHKQKKNDELKKADEEKEAAKKKVNQMLLLKGKRASLRNSASSRLLGSSLRSVGGVGGGGGGGGGGSARPYSAAGHGRRERRRSVSEILMEDLNPAAAATAALKGRTRERNKEEEASRKDPNKTKDAKDVVGSSLSSAIEAPLEPEQCKWCNFELGLDDMTVAREDARKAGRHRLRCIVCRGTFSSNETYSIRMIPIGVPQKTNGNRLRICGDGTHIRSAILTRKMYQYVFSRSPPLIFLSFYLPRYVKNDGRGRIGGMGR